APSVTNARGIPAPSVRRLRLVPSLPRSVGLGPVAAPPKGALFMAPSRACQSQLSASQFIISQQLCQPQYFEEACLFPLLKTIMDSRAGSQFAGQRVPLDTCTQNVNNGLKGTEVAFSNLLITQP